MYAIFHFIHSIWILTAKLTEYTERVGICDLHFDTTTTEFLDVQHTYYPEDLF